MRLSVVIVNWNLETPLRACLLSLSMQVHRDLEVIVVDNGSTDGTVPMIEREFPWVTLVRHVTNLGFAGGVNAGIVRSTGPWVATLNNDATAEPDWAAALVESAESAEPSCGMLQALMRYAARPAIVNSTGIVLGVSGHGNDRDEGRSVSAAAEPAEIFCPSAGAAAYRRTMLEAVRLRSGYFDSRYFLYYEDLDLGWRARLAGWGARYVPRAVVRHQWHASTDRIGLAEFQEYIETNRVRTLVKNASLALLVRTILGMVRSAARVGRVGRSAGLRRFARAALESWSARAQVTALATRRRADVEREWLGRR
jgi:GT2 family glycosyltransferase